MSLMPIVRVLAAGSDSRTDFARFVLRFPPREGAIYMNDSSELNVTEGGRVSFCNNHAGVSGGKYCDSCLRSWFPRLNRRADDQRHHFVLVALRQEILLILFLTGASHLFGRSVFYSYGTVSFVSNEAEFGGAM